ERREAPLTRERTRRQADEVDARIGNATTPRLPRPRHGMAPRPRLPVRQHSHLSAGDVVDREHYPAPLGKIETDSRRPAKRVGIVLAQRVLQRPRGVLTTPLAQRGNRAALAAAGS